MIYSVVKPNSIMPHVTYFCWCWHHKRPRLARHPHLHVLNVGEKTQKSSAFADDSTSTQNFVHESKVKEPRLLRTFHRSDRAALGCVLWTASFCAGGWGPNSPICVLCVCCTCLLQTCILVLHNLCIPRSCQG